MSAAVAPILKTTPFHARTAPLIRAQTWRRWSGYQVASAYEAHPDQGHALVTEPGPAPLWPDRPGSADEQH